MVKMGQKTGLTMGVMIMKMLVLTKEVNMCSTVTNMIMLMLMLEVLLMVMLMLMLMVMLVVMVMVFSVGLPLIDVAATYVVSLRSR